MQQVKNNAFEVECICIIYMKLQYIYTTTSFSYQLKCSEIDMQVVTTDNECCKHDEHDSRIDIQYRHRDKDCI